MFGPLQSSVRMPRVGARNSTKTSVIVPSSMAVRPFDLVNGNALIPLKFSLSVPRKVRMRVVLQSDINLGAPVHLSGNINLVSSSCGKRLYLLLSGLSGGSVRVGDKAQVTRLIPFPALG